jgi:hypothetical protein
MDVQVAIRIKETFRRDGFAKMGHRRLRSFRIARRGPEGA